MWIKVAKHWNNASSGRFGSFDLIEKLWYKIPNSKEETLEEYKEKNIAFLYAKNFFPFMKTFWEARKNYARPTIFNILWPLLSPANSDYQMIGCSFEDKMELMIEACLILWKKNVMIVRWEDWLDEVTLTWKTKIFELKNWKIKNYEISPEDFWFQNVKLVDILEKDIDKKIELANKIIAWENAWSYSDLVDINVKVALNFLNKF
jgi:anthranilate phosphoribosyltransferase